MKWGCIVGHVLVHTGFDCFILVDILGGGAALCDLWVRTEMCSGLCLLVYTGQYCFV